MKKLFFVLLITTCGCASNTKISLTEIKKSQPETETSQILSDLSSNQFQGRKPGTVGYERAMWYVEAFLKMNNLKPYFEKSFKDTVSLDGVVSANIVAVIGDRDVTKKHILIGAHLDHLGLSKNRTDSIFNGANDNASGVTAVLQIAKVLSKYKFEQNIIIALFTEEESGLNGSMELAKKLKAKKVNLAYMLNFEMIGKTLTTGPNQVYITGFDKSDCAHKMNEIAAVEFVKYLPAEISYELFSRSDNFSFYQEFQVPSHTISTFDFQNYDHYHEASDEMERLDIANMNIIINTCTFIISQLLRNDVELVATQKGK